MADLIDYCRFDVQVGDAVELKNGQHHTVVRTCMPYVKQRRCRDNVEIMFDNDVFASKYTMNEVKRIIRS